VPLKKEDIFPPFLQEEKLPEHKLLLETLYFPPPLEEIFSEISIYDFDSKLLKTATPITGKAELEEDGSNLPIILKNITGNRERRRKLLNLIKDVLPFVENLDVEKFADKSLLFKLYSPKNLTLNTFKQLMGYGRLTEKKEVIHKV